MNPILAKMGQTQKVSPLQNLKQIKQMWKMFSSMGNPNEALTQAMQNNPKVQEVNDLINQAGGDPKKAFYDLCKEKGVDPEDILDIMR